MQRATARALASIVRNSFQPGTYTIDTGYATAPTLDRSAIRDRMLDVANERLEIATTVGSARTLSSMARNRDDFPDRTRVTEVAYIKGSIGGPRLAMLKSTWQGHDTVPGHSSHEFKRWVTEQGRQAAIDQWMTERHNQQPQT